MAATVITLRYFNGTYEVKKPIVLKGWEAVMEEMIWSMGKDKADAAVTELKAGRNTPTSVSGSYYRIG